jgi:hypothetical protein
MKIRTSSRWKSNARWKSRTDTSKANRKISNVESQNVEVWYRLPWRSTITSGTIHRLTKQATAMMTVT